LNSGAGTFFDAFLTEGASVDIFMNLIDAYLFKYPRDETSRTEEVTERPKEKKACRNYY